MKNKSIQKQLLLTSFLTVLLFGALFFKMEYATDTYTIINVGMHLFGDSMFQNGRLVTAAAFYSFEKVLPNITVFYYVSFLLAILFATLAVFEMAKIINRSAAPKLAFLLAFLSVLNPLSVEYFLFIEKGYFMLAIFMSVLALKFFIRFLEGKKLCLLWSYLCITVTAFTYQSILAVFAALAVPFSLILAKNIKALLKNIAFAISVYGFGALLNFFFIKFIGKSSRAGSGICFKNLATAFFFAGPLPSILIYLAIFGLLFAICSLYIKRRNPTHTKQQILSLFGACSLTIMGTLLSTFFPFLFISSSELWLPCRIIYPIGTLLTTLPLLFICFNQEKPSREMQKTSKSPARLIAAFGILLALNFIFFQTMFAGRLRNNYLDHDLCFQIGDLIAEYESASGNEIRSISIYHDTKLSKRNPGVLSMGDSNVRAFSKDWSDVNHMNVVLGREFEKADCNEQIYQANFANRNWDAFHPDQLFFVDNTLHLCVY